MTFRVAPENGTIIVPWCKIKKKFLNEAQDGSHIGCFLQTFNKRYDVIMGNPPCQGLTLNWIIMRIYLLKRSIFITISSERILGYLPTAGEMKWPVLELYFGGLGYGR